MILKALKSKWQATNVCPGPLNMSQHGGKIEREMSVCRGVRHVGWPQFIINLVLLEAH